MATFRDVKKAFFAMDAREQEQILKELYGFSKEVKAFVNMRLLEEGAETFLEEIRKACLSETSKGFPKNIDVRKVIASLSRAKKSKVPPETLYEMEWIAFEGYVTFLNTYGGGPESYENKAYDHLKNYLTLILKHAEGELQEALLDKANTFLGRHTNMYNDHLWELFEEMDPAS